MARAVADAQEARNQRDNALEAQHTLQLEEQAWKQEVMTYKASVRVSYQLPVYSYQTWHMQLKQAEISVRLLLASKRRVS